MLEGQVGSGLVASRWVRCAAVALLALWLGACSSGNRTMMVMVRDAATQEPVVHADVSVRRTSGTSISRFERTRTLTEEDGSILVNAPVRQSVQITVQTEDGSYGRFVIDHPGLGVPTPWTGTSTIGYEYGARKFQISAIEWTGGKQEESVRIPWKEPTPRAE